MSIELQADNSEVFAELKKILPKSLGRNVAAVIVSEFAAVLCSKLMTVPRIGESHLVPLMGIKRAPPRAQRPAPVEAKPVPSSCEAWWEGRSSETFCMAWPSFHCKWVSIGIVYLARFPIASGICFFSIFGLCGHKVLQGGAVRMCLKVCTQSANVGPKVTKSHGPCEELQHTKGPGAHFAYRVVVTLLCIKGRTLVYMRLHLGTMQQVLRLWLHHGAGISSRCLRLQFPPNWTYRCGMPTREGGWLVCFFCMEKGSVSCQCHR